MIRPLITATLIFLQVGSVRAEKPDSVFSLHPKPFPRVAIPIMAAATAGAFFLDKPIRDHNVAHPSAFKNDFSEITDVFGEKTIMIPTVVAAYGVGRFVFKVASYLRITKMCS
ncbi:hypothetical protein [Anaerophaga thermohalophila]|uniref:hypothetical protein n=1 Tax=Anaerophaga thermohalophila TaxID=177400 RepID=UPI000492B9A3|nr:hypothetical protein [Anaerophaga thermohalophila]